MNRFLALAFVAVFFSACLRVPGTNTGNPDGPVNHSPISDIGTKVLGAVALEICTQRQRCFDISSDGCVEMIWNLPKAAQVFDTYQNASTWSDLATVIDKNEAKINQSEIVGCFDQLNSVDCQDPEVDRSLNRFSFDFIQLNNFLSSVPSCRAIVNP